MRAMKETCGPGEFAVFVKDAVVFCYVISRLESEAREVVAALNDEVEPSAIVCMYCNVCMTSGIAPFSHGTCKACAAKMLAAIENRRRGPSSSQ